MLKTDRRPERKGKAAKEDYYFGDDLETILSAIDDNILDENEKFTSEINAVVEDVGDHTPSSGFSCDLCDKVCKTQRELTTHRNSKHKTVNVEWGTYAVYPPPPTHHFFNITLTLHIQFLYMYIHVYINAENRLHPFHFKKYIEECSKIVC